MKFNSLMCSERCLYCIILYAMVEVALPLKRQGMITESTTPNYWNGTTENGERWEIYSGDALEVLRQFSDTTKFDCVVTSPPYYWLRDYGVITQIGHEKTVQKYV